MRLALCAGGWGVSLLLCWAVLRLRRRLHLVARAAHELRGPATAIALAAATLRREPGGPRRALAFESQLDRMQAGLRDLELARSGRRAAPRDAVVPLERLLRGAAAGWRPVVGAGGRGLRVRSQLGATAVRADRGRLAQALCNLLANAVEHGSGTIELHGRRSGDRVVLEVRDQGSERGGRDRRRKRPDRGHGLGIANAVAEEAGGSLRLEREDGATVAALELPVAKQ